MRKSLPPGALGEKKLQLILSESHKLQDGLCSRVLPFQRLASLETDKRKGITKTIEMLCTNLFGVVATEQI
jgi:hypothetical protein